MGGKGEGGGGVCELFEQVEAPQQICGSSLDLGRSREISLDLRIEVDNFPTSPTGERRMLRNSNHQVKFAISKK